MSSYAKELNTAEVAYAAIQEVKHSLYPLHIVSFNMFFITSENEILGIIYSLLTGRQSIL